MVLDCRMQLWRVHSFDIAQEPSAASTVARCRLQCTKNIKKMQVYSCLFMFAMFANHSVCMHDIFRNRKILEFTISRYTIFANKEKHSWTVHAFYTFPNTEQFWQIKNLGKLFLLSGQDTLNAKVIGKSDAYVQ